MKRQLHLRAKMRSSTFRTRKCVWARQAGFLVNHRWNTNRSNSQASTPLERITKKTWSRRRSKLMSSSQGSLPALWWRRPTWVDSILRWTTRPTNSQSIKSLGPHRVLTLARLQHRKCVYRSQISSWETAQSRTLLQIWRSTRQRPRCNTIKRRGYQTQTKIMRPTLSIIQALRNLSSLEMNWDPKPIKGNWTRLRQIIGRIS